MDEAQKAAETKKKEALIEAKEEILKKAMDTFDYRSPENIPYIDDINRNISFNDAEDKSYGNLLRHKIEVVKKLPKWMLTVSKKYN